MNILYSASLHLLSYVIFLSTYFWHVIFFQQLKGYKCIMHIDITNVLRGIAHLVYTHTHTFMRVCICVCSCMCIWMQHASCEMHGRRNHPSKNEHIDWLFSLLKCWYIIKKSIKRQTCSFSNDARSELIGRYTCYHTRYYNN